MNTILGQNLGLFIDNQVLHGSGATSGDTCFAFATNCSIDLSVDAIDITSKDSGSWSDSLPNRKSWTISTDCLYSEDYDAMMLLAINRTVFTVRWCSCENTESNNTVTHVADHTVGSGTYNFYEGSVFIDSISSTAGTDEAANFTCSLTGKGKLKIIGPSGEITTVDNAIHA